MDKAIELIRVGIREPMTIDRLLKVINLANAEDTDTLRVYNGNLIVERPPSTVETLPI